MNVLACDTASELLGVALSISGGSVPGGSVPGGSMSGGACSLTIDGRPAHGRNVMPAIEHLLRWASASIDDIDLFVCGLGPGSFTGLRIGMATMKGLSAGSGKPFVSVPTLDALAWPLMVFTGLVAPIIDARRQRWYSALYRNGNKLTPDLDVPATELLARYRAARRIPTRRCC